MQTVDSNRSMESVLSKNKKASDHGRSTSNRRHNVAGSSTAALGSSVYLGREKPAHFVNAHTLNPDFTRPRHGRVENAFAPAANGRDIAHPLNINPHGALEAKDTVRVDNQFFARLQSLRHAAKRKCMCLMRVTIDRRAIPDRHQ